MPKRVNRKVKRLTYPGQVIENPYPCVWAGAAGASRSGVALIVMVVMAMVVMVVDGGDGAAGSAGGEGFVLADFGSFVPSRISLGIDCLCPSVGVDDPDLWAPMIRNMV